MAKPLVANAFALSMPATKRLGPKGVGLRFSVLSCQFPVSVPFRVPCFMCVVKHN